MTGWLQCDWTHLSAFVAALPAVEQACGCAEWSAGECLVSTDIDWSLFCVSQCELMSVPHLCQAYWLRQKQVICFAYVSSCQWSCHIYWHWQWHMVTCILPVSPAVSDQVAPTDMDIDTWWSVFWYLQQTSHTYWQWHTMECALPVSVAVSEWIIKSHTLILSATHDKVCFAIISSHQWSCHTYWHWQWHVISVLSHYQQPSVIMSHLLKLTLVTVTHAEMCLLTYAVVNGHVIFTDTCCWSMPLVCQCQQLSVFGLSHGHW